MSQRRTKLPSMLRREQIEQLVHRFYLDVWRDAHICPVFERALSDDGTRTMARVALSMPGDDAWAIVGWLQPFSSAG